MFIILVGPDGAGKSTLARRLANMFNLKIEKRDKPKSEEEKANMFKKYLHEANVLDNVIYDRYIYCEQVYGPVMRDEKVVDATDVRRLENKLAKKGAFIVHCTDTTDNLWKRCQARGEDYVPSKETLDSIREGYHKVLSASSLPVFRYTIE